MVKYPEGLAHLKPGVRPFFADEVRLLKDTCARMAFWNLSKTKLKEIAKFLQVPMEDHVSDVDLVFKLIQDCTKLGDDEVMKIMAKRSGHLRREAEFAPSMLEIDAAVSVLDKVDHRQLSDEQRSAANSIEEQKTFDEAFTVKMASI